MTVPFQAETGSSPYAKTMAFFEDRISLGQNLGQSMEEWQTALQELRNGNTQTAKAILTKWYESAITQQREAGSGEEHTAAIELDDQTRDMLKELN